MNHFDLAAAARQEMVREGFDPDFPPGTDEQLADIRRQPPVLQDGIQDLRDLLWSSIDNDSTRDLDQIEWAERVPDGIRVLVGIADVAARVTQNSPIDQHASGQTTSVYTQVRTFPMLPEELSTDLTSLGEGVDRLSVVIEFVVSGGGDIASPKIFRALVRNKAQLTYDATGAWLEGRAAAPVKVAESADLQAQLRLQNEAAGALRTQRHKLGAIQFDRSEAQASVTDGKVTGFSAVHKTLANDLIEDFMVAANEVMARTLRDRGVPSIRRVVRTPERWPRIVELAARYGEKLPPEPDAKALNDFLQRRRTADPDHYADLSLAVVKLMGPGEYVMARPGEEEQGHFGLAVHDYTHSTAPNRRFADLVTQRLIRWDKPYTEEQLVEIARNCTLKEDMARKVERTMAKRIAAVALQDRVGQTFRGVISGVTPKGVFVRVFDPPVEGRIVRGEAGADVGDRVQVRLIATDPQRGYIDFAL